MKLELTYAPGTIALASILALRELGLEARLTRVDFAKAEQQSADYLAINPKGRVPALITEGAVLTETGAILRYLASLNPGAGLVPGDAMQVARMDELMFYLASTMHVNHAHKLRGHRWADQPASHADMTAKVPQTMGESAGYVEGLLTGPYLLGDTPSLADIYLFAVVQWLAGDNVDIADFPKLDSFYQSFAARASAQHAREIGAWQG